MKKLILLSILMLSILSTQAQHFIGLNKDSIETKLKQLHGDNIQGKGYYNVYQGKSIVYDIYIPAIKQNVTLIYNVNSKDICFQYLRLCDNTQYENTWNTIFFNSTQIDDTHFVDDASIMWTFHQNKQSDYFTLIAEQTK